MPQDPYLYGQPRKKQKRELEVSSSLAFTAQLNSLLAASSAASDTNSTARARSSRSQSSDLAGIKVKRKDGDSKAKDESSAEGKKSNKLNLKSPPGSSEPTEAERELIQRKLESKARLYAAMQRGDYIGKEIGLVDFDRKWAEQQEAKEKGEVSSSSDSDSDLDVEDSNIDTELVEWEDEFGRLRRTTRAEKLRYERRLARGLASAAELETMSARPKAPSQVIYGDTVQTEAFVARDFEKMEELARKRDRSPTPPPAVHYDADKEIRTRGVGFYKFSSEEEKRQAEMKALEEERERTEQVRREREDRLAKRRKEIEERRREIAERRARKMAESFLEGLGRDLEMKGASTTAGDEEKLQGEESKERSGKDEDRKD
ncbi:uncharacterized protein CTHT_0043830 [Thermochaetoides thermophila DSM 1495]|uniref:Coiled-coil domain-containing protein 174 n=1 Tax=Chaetomium thermophilum (strain DSM 1495 / CBS 144.50 / IMI 039719) TaxID=759272 RepID=G0S8Y0_CHATD|nr:hypothetical protein CTHT_0043830 [Thermochaetoides thermophila DSM 1495]EGS19891.1 hypothetical protein CTHT_0043830 [Thermochaetoides thermophila DSM 1495]